MPSSIPNCRPLLGRGLCLRRDWRRPPLYRRGRPGFAVFFRCSICGPELTLLQSRSWSPAVSGAVYRQMTSPQFESVVVTAQATPNPELTPGAVRPVTRNEICAAGHRDMNRLVSSAMQQEVFKKYGVPVALKNDYEVDYLITPELGGADDMQNLWPEPYSSTDWGAHVKDALEDRLHQMVCEGTIDLGTAQREMASDWISAYKKYFHTDRPLVMDSANPAEKSESKVVTGKST